MVGPHAAWAGEKSRSLPDLESAGNLRDTILVVEVPYAGVSWMEPRDVTLDEEDETKLPPLWPSDAHGIDDKEFLFTSAQGPRVYAAMADGSVRAFKTYGDSMTDVRKVLRVGTCQEGELARHPNWPNIAALAVWLLSVGTLLTHAVWSRKVRSVPPKSS